MDSNKPVIVSFVEKISFMHTTMGTKLDQKEDKNVSHSRISDYSLAEIKQGWQEYLNKTPEERAIFKDPFQFSSKDLHLNNCLRVIPDQLKEEIKYAEQNHVEEDNKYDNYELQLKMFLASSRPKFPAVTNKFFSV